MMLQGLGFCKSRTRGSRINLVVLFPGSLLKGKGEAKNLGNSW